MESCKLQHDVDSTSSAVKGLLLTAGFNWLNHLHQQSVLQKQGVAAKGVTPCVPQPATVAVPGGCAVEGLQAVLN